MLLATLNIIARNAPIEPAKLEALFRDDAQHGIRILKFYVERSGNEAFAQEAEDLERVEGFLKDPDEALDANTLVQLAAVCGRLQGKCAILPTQVRGAKERDMLRRFGEEASDLATLALAYASA
ncbi:hypothetical protein [Lichenifustis flavocetrariae]|uniref:Uncharacterized protein n=1 Tax=Lichenifustis flavocetrariae TaxID=2949735 RepID=A0AA41YU48_9HYPH|nr:hypothetical protein [Lichenifustis flavocetrariae]MCW6507072.1 hypothetical protein [Lichenifustis flavocetrariae]